MKRVMSSDVIEDFYGFMDDAASFKGWGEADVAEELRVAAELRSLRDDIRNAFNRARELRENYPKVDVTRCRALLAAANNAVVSELEKWEDTEKWEDEE